jgi:sec-independent protein translocase protein TatC
MAFSLFDRKKQQSGAEMSFIDHLEALRGHIVRAVLAILVCAVVFFIYRDWIFDYIITAPLQSNFVTYTALCNFSHWAGFGESLCMQAPSFEMQTTTVGGQFMAAITISIIGGIIVAFPYIFWEFWKFIKPALKPSEVQYTRNAIFWVSFFFFTGSAFAYFILGPFTFSFLSEFKLGTKNLIVTKPTLADYLENLTNLILGCAIAFELPVLAYILTRVGLITPSFLRKSRKYAVVVILVVAAVITPSPDWTSQMLVFLPLWFLYELGIIVSGRVAREEKRKEAEWS